MVHYLEMPHSLAAVGFEREHAIRKKILSDAIATVVIIRRRTGASEYQARVADRASVRPSNWRRPVVFQASGGQVSYPDSPGCGIV